VTIIDECSLLPKEDIINVARWTLTVY